MARMIGFSTDGYQGEIGIMELKGEMRNNTICCGLWAIIIQYIATFLMFILQSHDADL